MLKLENLNGIKSIEISNQDNDYWQIKFEVFQNNLNSFRSIDKIRKIVQTSDDLILYRRPSPFRFIKNEEDFQVIIENTNNRIRPEEIIDKIRNDEPKDEMKKNPPKDFNIKSQFLFSWDEIEKFYRFSFIDKYCEWKNPALGFIKELRKLGYDKIFRAGQQLSIFILSRCLNHGMRQGTNHLRIIFLDEHQMEVISIVNGKEIKKDIFRIGINDDLINILEKMKIENEIK